MPIIDLFTIWPNISFHTMLPGSDVMLTITQLAGSLCLFCLFSFLSFNIGTAVWVFWNPTAMPGAFTNEISLGNSLELGRTGELSLLLENYWCYLWWWTSVLILTDWKGLHHPSAIQILNSTYISLLSVITKSCFLYLVPLEGFLQQVNYSTVLTFSLVVPATIFSSISRALIYFYSS